MMTQPDEIYEVQQISTTERQPNIKRLPRKKIHVQVPLCVCGPNKIAQDQQPKSSLNTR